MNISPDSIIYLKWGMFHINATIVFTWGIMIMLTLGSWLVTRSLSSAEKLSRWQNLLEVLVDGMRSQIDEISKQDPDQYLDFVGTLFIFIAVSNLLTIFPGYRPPTGSLSTTAGLAACVFIAVPLYGIVHQGLSGYLHHYIKPSVFMMPFNIMGEFSRTIALAVRLFGNVMSGHMIVAILVSIVPLIFPVVMQALGLLTGLIQAYIFAVLAIVYIASSARSLKEKQRTQKDEDTED
ncbi:MAG: F0F1 ATP synthase subunit A [Desulfocapsaceae bacterium]|jgi:F-type H+-transporting ATPase subunit a|nr:F0F1 ATP synthase subunit A [Desulfocapsaceae bacterium]